MSDESNETTIFQKIVDRQVTTDIVYQDDYVTAFRDITPKAPVHLLIVSNHPFPTLNSVREQDEPCLGRMLKVAAQLAKKEGIAESGYRIVLNCNADGGQEIYHLHLHVLGGEPLGSIR